MTARGITLNNLTNIRKSKDTWQGSATEQPDPDFVNFLSPKWSIRATARLLILYQDRLGKGTISVAELINTWAPPVENKTSSYVDFVCSKCDLTPDQQIDITQYASAFPVIRAMIQEEVGLAEYDAATVTEGLKLAGIVPPLASATRTPAYTVGAVTAVMGAATPVIQQATTLVSTASPILLSLAHVAPYIVGAILVLGATYLIIHEMQKRKVAV